MSPAPAPAEAAEVLRFWFEECRPEQWFEADPAFDAAVRARFAALWRRGAAGELAGWRETPEGALALVIVLDQFPRNIFRGTPKAYASDPLARAVADDAVARGFDLALGEKGRKFLYLPFEHSEDLADQRRSVALVAERCADPESLDYARRHLEIIERFGRFPHRNAILGRPSTPEEETFLREPDSSF